jgi:hypothetical protein
MQNEPHCTLCSDVLVLEEIVSIQAGYPGWNLAWVSPICSAASPVATGTGGVLRRPTPLYEDGRRVTPDSHTGNPGQAGEKGK